MYVPTLDHNHLTSATASCVLSNLLGFNLLGLAFSNTKKNMHVLELCDNLDNKIIETVNFIVIKIMNFYYRDNIKFLDITAYFTKTNLRNNYKPRHAHTYVFH